MEGEAWRNQAGRSEAGEGGELLIRRGMAPDKRGAGGREHHILHLARREEGRREGAFVCAEI